MKRNVKKTIFTELRVPTPPTPASPVPVNLWAPDYSWQVHCSLVGAAEGLQQPLRLGHIVGVALVNLGAAAATAAAT
jgi:hypothetical protein